MMVMMMMMMMMRMMMMMVAKMRTGKKRGISCGPRASQVGYIAGTACTCASAQGLQASRHQNRMGEMKNNKNKLMMRKMNYYCPAGARRTSLKWGRPAGAPHK